MTNKSEQFQVVELGTSYMLRKFRMVDGKGIDTVKKYCIEKFKMNDGMKETFQKGFQYSDEPKHLLRWVSEFALNFPEFEFRVTENPDYQPQEITFVRGDKSDNGNVIPRVDGITHEQLLGTMITDLEYKISLVPSSESSEALKNLKQALFWLNERTNNRVKREVEGTYQK